MQFVTRRKLASNLFIIIIALFFAFLVLWQVTTWLVDTYVYWSNYQTIEVHVVRFEKSRFDSGYRQSFSDDYKTEAFYVQTEELGWMRADIYSLDAIGPGLETFDITRKKAGGEWWIVKVYFQDGD